MDYTSPSGKILKIVIIPDVEVFLYGDYNDIPSIKSLNVGYELIFVRDILADSKIYVEIALLRPLVKDE